MVKSEQQRQKKLARKRAKEKESRQQLARAKQQMTSVAGQMQAGAHGEVYGCYRGKGLNGLTTILLARRISGGRVAIASFLVDTYCLGAKDAFGRLGTPADFDEMQTQMSERQEMLPCAPGAARKFVESAVAYAHSLGFSPHPGYRKVAPIWGDIDPGQSDEEFTFGRNGRPLYFAGPREDKQRQNFIYNRLCQTVGEGNFDFAVVTSPELERMGIDEWADTDEGEFLRLDLPEGDPDD